MPRIIVSCVYRKELTQRGERLEYLITSSVEVEAPDHAAAQVLAERVLLRREAWDRVHGFRVLFTAERGAEQPMEEAPETERMVRYEAE